MINGKAINAPAGKLSASLVALVLAACGGSGSDSDAPSAPAQDNPPQSGDSQNPPPPPPPTGNDNTGSENTAPVLSGTPGTSATAGQPYTFKPSASDADNDTLTFSIQNKPAWATFSTADGTLSGTPSAADVGTTPSITISVTDGTETVALNAFTITVKDPPVASTGSVTLDWTPPDANTDGSSLTDLASYRIRYGKSPSALDQSVRVDNPGLTSYVVENLTAATWYFSISAINKAGVESLPSNPVSATVQ